MKVLLINPPFQRLKGISFDYFSLGLGYLATGPADAGFDVAIYDGELPAKGEFIRPQSNEEWFDSHGRLVHALETKDHPIWREIDSVLTSFKPDVVGLSVSTPAYNSARKVSELCKSYSEKCTVVWGGVHPTLLPEDVLRKEENVDYAVRGEGEITLTELLNHIADGEPSLPDIDGLAYRQGDEIKINRQREVIPNLDEVPFPRRDLLINGVDKKRVFRNIMGSRGCPYNCAYCASSKIWNRRVRFRSATSILQEVAVLRDEYHVSEVEFWDDTFTLKRKWTVELCEAMVSEKLNLSWWCNTRADLLDEEILKTMKAAGCTALHVGVETGSDRTLEYLNRKMSLEDVHEASRLLEKAHMTWFAYFMFGFPHETVEDIMQTRKMMHELSAAYLTLSIFNPYPGTALFEECKKLGLISENPDWGRFSHQSPENCFSKNISREEFQKIVREVMLECDKINSSFSKRAKRVLGKRAFYMRNPGAFLLLFKQWFRKARYAARN